MHEPEFYFLILLTYTTPSVIDIFREIYVIFEKCVQFNVLNAVVMMRDPSGSISFYTYNLFRYDCIRTVQTTKCNHYYDDILENDYLFPLRLRDFYNCTFHVAVRILPPLLQFNGDINKTQDLHDMHRLTGVDGDLIKLLAKIMNFQMVLHFSNNTSVVGKEQNLSDCFEMVITLKGTKH